MAGGDLVVTSGSAALAAVLGAVHDGRWAAVADPRWPSALLDGVRDELERAVERGRLGAGDLVLFTSGSTGRPRAVVRGAASWDASAAPLSAVTGIGRDDAVWLPGPLSSSLFLHGAWHAHAVGATALPQREPPRAATALHAVPSLLVGAVEAGEAGALPRMRTAVVAGDALPGPLRRRAEGLGWRVVEYYGAAELSFVAWRDGTGPLRPFPGAQVAERDGVLWVRSPYLSRGYLDDHVDDGPGAGPLRRDGAWASVGDLGAVGPDGGVRVHGRGSTAVTTGGTTVVVEEVERALAAADGVAEVAVVGVAHPHLGAVLAAVVVPAAGPGTPTAPASRLRSGLAAACAGLPRPARPVRWHTADALPRTASGKVDREQLAVAVRDGAAPRLRRT